jgi:hypothetical protein
MLSGCTIYSASAFEMLSFCWRSGAFTGLSNHQAAPAVLTFVAPVAMLGDELATQTAWHQIATGLWLLGCISWAGFIYAFFMLLTTRCLKRSPLRGLDGSWLLIVVATEALAVLGSYVDEWHCHGNRVWPAGWRPARLAA